MDYNWFVRELIKTAKGRRFSPEDRIRYITGPRKGTGKGVVQMPPFAKGKIVDFNTDTRRYNVESNNGEIIDIHPRNLFTDPNPVSPEKETLQSDTGAFI